MCVNLRQRPSGLKGRASVMVRSPENRFSLFFAILSDSVLEDNDISSWKHEYEMYVHVLQSINQWWKKIEVCVFVCFHYYILQLNLIEHFLKTFGMWVYFITSTYTRVYYRSHQTVGLAVKVYVSNSFDSFQDIWIIKKQLTSAYPTILSSC